MRDKITSALEICGMLMIVIGIGSFNVPVGVIVAGVFAVVVGYLG